VAKWDSSTRFGPARFYPIEDKPEWASPSKEKRPKNLTCPIL